jgi:hypothetical protein
MKVPVKKRKKRLEMEKNSSFILSLFHFLLILQREIKINNYLEYELLVNQIEKSLSIGSTDAAVS